MSNVSVYKTISRHWETVAVHALQPNASVERTAICLALGLVIGVMPLIWGTSVLCFLVAWTFRLNHILIQGVNYLLYPVHIGLLWPFFHFSTLLFGHSAPVDVTLLHRINTLSLDMISEILVANMYALLLWLMLSVCCIPPLYFLFTFILRRFHIR